MTTAPKDLDALRAHYDTTDTSADLERAELDTSTVADPMVGVTLRLPAATLNAARAVARQRGLRVTALLREWIEAGLTSDAPDDAMVSVRDLRHAMAAAMIVELQDGTQLRIGDATSRDAQRA